MKEILLAETPSTNSYVARHVETLPVPCAVRAVAQTAGRGQRGNSWEAEPGRNLTLSFLLRPEGILPREQFAVSEAVALAVCDTLQAHGIEAEVKWPNDIYVGDKKICGILIEHSLYGHEIRYSIAGVGLNVNQEAFLSDAPNPVSMAQLTGRQYDLSDMCARLGRAVEERMAQIASPEGRRGLHAEFMRRLWRRQGGPWPFRDAATGREFRAHIADVTPEGYLALRTSDKPSDPPSRLYAFKEVAFIL